MNSLFVDPNEEITVSIAIGTSKKTAGAILADINKETLEKTFADDLGEVEEHTVTFRLPTFADSVLYSSVKVEDDVVSVNPAEIRAERMIRLLKAWTFKELGEIVPVTRDAVLSLQPIIAAVLLIQLDTALRERGLI